MAKLINGQITINGKEYLLRYDVNVLCDMHVAGLNVMTIDDAFDIPTLRKLVFFGLQKFHKKDVKTEERAGELISDYLEGDGTLEELSDTLSSVLTKAMGIKEAVEGK